MALLDNFVPKIGPGFIVVMVNWTASGGLEIMDVSDVEFDEGISVGFNVRQNSQLLFVSSGLNLFQCRILWELWGDRKRLKQRTHMVARVHRQETGVNHEGVNTRQMDHNRPRCKIGIIRLVEPPIKR